MSGRFFVIQLRLESIEAVNKIVEEANKRIQPTGTGMCMKSVIIFPGWVLLLESYFIFFNLLLIISGAIWGSSRSAI